MRVAALPGQSNGLRLNWRIRWRYDPTRSTLKMEETIAATAPIFTRSPRNDNPSQMLKPSNPKEQAEIQYLVMSYRGHVACQGIFLYIHVMFFDGEVLKKTSFHILFILCVVQRNNIAFSSVVKNSFLRALFFPPQKRNKQTNKTKTKRKQKNIQVLF